MGIDRLIHSLIAWAFALGAMGTLDQAIQQLAYQATTQPRTLSLQKLNQALVGKTRQIVVISIT